MRALRVAILAIAAAAALAPAASAADLGGGPPYRGSVKDEPYVRPFT